jgi:Zn finger protein HypA/HybF involved in hydrogenase expression
MDAMDYATETSDFLTEVALKKVFEGQNLAKGQRLVIDLSNPSRECLYCGGETESGQHRWCSLECRRDWEEENE